MIPLFDPEGYLPEGVHDATWPEIERAFGFTPRHRHLLEGLRAGLSALASAGCRKAYIDGSFVTAKALPGDVDVCYDTAGMRRELLDPALRAFADRRAAQKAKFSAEFFPVHLTATLAPPTPFLDFFQQTRRGDRKKGIVVIDPRSLP